VTAKTDNFWSLRNVDFCFRGKTYFKTHHYSPAITKSEADKIIGLYVNSNSVLSRSELVTEKPLP